MVARAGQLKKMKGKGPVVAFSGGKKRALSWSAVTVQLASMVKGAFRQNCALHFEPAFVQSPPSARQQVLHRFLFFFALASASGQPTLVPPAKATTIPRNVCRRPRREGPAMSSRVRASKRLVSMGCFLPSSLDCRWLERVWTFGRERYEAMEQQAGKGQEMQPHDGGWQPR